MLVLGMQVSDVTSRWEFIIETRDKNMTFFSYFPIFSLYVQLSQISRFGVCQVKFCNSLKNPCTFGHGVA